jgi:hypothetical protein
VRVVGCPSNSSYSTPTSCGPTTALSSKVAYGQSWTVGPGLTPTPVRSDALYLRVVGNQIPLLGSFDVMNRANIAERIATIEIDTSNYNPPPIVLEGAAVVSPQPAALVDAGSIDILTDDVAFTQAGGLLRDLDGDGIVDESDKCIYAYDPNNTDRGGLGTMAADGKGDVCQCGEGHGLTVDPEDGGGVVDNDDVILLQKALTGESTDAEVGLRCSVSGNGDCDIKDAVVLQLATDGGVTPAGPGIGSVCQRAVSVFTGGNQ